MGLLLFSITQSGRYPSYLDQIFYIIEDNIDIFIDINDILICYTKLLRQFY
uniref:Uncharacterized protein n=1 Tax=Rhizophagus irregularis (strain DAOM 181602 / DAOM 197198 / MUCL 43194) TaxID=747089 RepID=U9TCU2_RHIID